MLANGTFEIVVLIEQSLADQGRLFVTEVRRHGYFDVTFLLKW